MSIYHQEAIGYQKFDISSKIHVHDRPPEMQRVYDVGNGEVPLGPYLQLWL